MYSALKSGSTHIVSFHTVRNSIKLHRNKSSSVKDFYEARFDRKLQIELQESLWNHDPIGTKFARLQTSTKQGNLHKVKNAKIYSHMSQISLGQLGIVVVKTKISPPPTALLGWHLPSLLKITVTRFIVVVTTFEEVHIGYHRRFTSIYSENGILDWNNLATPRVVFEILDFFLIRANRLKVLWGRARHGQFLFLSHYVYKRKGNTLIMHSKKV